MKTFKEFLKTKYNEQMTLGTEFVDESQIDSIYNKSKYAVQIVQMYDQTRPMGQKFLPNIRTIATLNQGVYGLYTSADDFNVLPTDIDNLIFSTNRNDHQQYPTVPANSATTLEKLQNSNPQHLRPEDKSKLQKLPLAIIDKYYPNLKGKIKPSDVIHVNVQKHVQEKGDTLAAIVEIASTIIHECTHELDRKNAIQSQDSEEHPKAEEIAFKKWFSSNKSQILSKIPALSTMSGDEF